MSKKEKEMLKNNQMLILNFIHNITTINTQNLKPIKFAMLCCIRQEEMYYDQTIECLDFANTIKY